MAELSSERVLNGKPARECWICLKVTGGQEKTIAEHIEKVARNDADLSKQILAVRVPRVLIPVKKAKEKPVYKEVETRGIKYAQVVENSEDDNQAELKSDRLLHIKDMTEEELKRLTKVKTPGFIYVKVLAIVREVEFEDDNIELTERAWYNLRNTIGVNGFVGPNGVPTVMSQKDIRDACLEDGVYFSAGDNLIILDGAFKGKICTVAYEVKTSKNGNKTKRIPKIDYENGKVTVSVRIFGNNLSEIEVNIDDVCPIEV